MKPSNKQVSETTAGCVAPVAVPMGASAGTNTGVYPPKKKKKRVSETEGQEAMTQRNKIDEVGGFGSFGRRPYKNYGMGFKDTKRADFRHDSSREAKNNYGVFIGNRMWKVFATREEAEKRVRTLIAKGKDAHVLEVAAPVSEGTFKSGKSATDRVADAFKDLAGYSLDDASKYYQQMAKDAQARKQEYIAAGIISPDEEDEATDESDLEEAITPNHILGGLALVAALLGVENLTSARQTPLGKALAVAAQQGDREAAAYLANLDELIDTKQSATVVQLANKYLHKNVANEPAPTPAKESHIMKGLRR